MQKARHKRKVLDNPNRIPEHKNARITQKYKNVIPIPAKNQNLRKKEKNKLSILKILASNIKRILKIITKINLYLLNKERVKKKII